MPGSKQVSSLCEGPFATAAPLEFPLVSGDAEAHLSGHGVDSDFLQELDKVGIGRRVHHDEASIDRNGLGASRPCLSVGVATETSFFLEDVDFIFCALQGPCGTETSTYAAESAPVQKTMKVGHTATAYDGNLLPAFGSCLGTLDSHSFLEDVFHLSKEKVPSKHVLDHRCLAAEVDKGRG